MESSLRGIREKYRLPRDKDIKSQWWVNNVYSPASVPLAAIFLRTSLSANQVTVIWMIIGMVGVALVAFPFGWTTLGGCLCLFLHTTLDFADGIVARARHTISSTGIFLDRIGHDLIYPSLMFSLAIRGIRYFPPTWILITGFIASLTFVLYNNNRRSKILSYFFWQRQFKYHRLRMLIEEGIRGDVPKGDTPLYDVSSRGRVSPLFGASSPDQKMNWRRLVFRKLQWIWGPEKFLLIVYGSAVLGILQWIPIFYAVTTVPLFICSVYYQLKSQDRWVEPYLIESQSATDW